MNKFALVSLFSLVIINYFHVDALKCYECTTNDNPKCGDPFTAFDTATECSPAPEHIHHMMNQTKARFCRKLKQTIDGKHQIVTRSCGYLSNNETENNSKVCFKDAFSSFTSSLYCVCSDPECNGTVINSISNKSLLLTLVIAAIFKTLL